MMTINNILKKTIEENEITLEDFLQLNIFEKKILTSDNDFFETYEIWLALLIDLTLTSLQKEDYETLQLIKTAQKAMYLKYYNLCLQIGRAEMEWLTAGQEYYDDRLIDILT